MREIGIEVKSTLNFPPVKEMRSDVGKLTQQRKTCKESIETFEKQIEGQEQDRDNLTRLSKNPVEGGIHYNADACGEAARQSNKHIGMFKSLIKKEKAKIEQLNYMISEINKHICLSEQMLQ